MACALDNEIKEEAHKALRSFFFFYYPTLCGRRSSKYLLANMNRRGRATGHDRARGWTRVLHRSNSHPFSPCYVGYYYIIIPKEPNYMKLQDFIP